MRKFMLGLTLVLGAASLSACASTKRFIPTENVEGVTWRGFGAAQYDAQLADKRVGGVKVWSRGAFKGDSDLTTIEVGFEVTNSSDTPLVLRYDQVRLDVLTKNSEVDSLPPTQVAGAATVAPGRTSDVTLEFAMPNGVKPGQVRAFRVRWQLEGEGQMYVQSTPFTRLNLPSYAYYPYGYHGWGWYDYPYYPYHPYNGPIR